MHRDREKVTVRTLQKMKRSGTPISAITAYDAPTARLVDEAEIDLILVGDSLGMVVAGEANTLSVSLEQMIYHCKLVSSVNPKAFLLGDMPFGSYQVDVPSGVHSAIRMVKEGRVEGVKLEGGQERLPVVSAIVESGIPVMGHIGLMPQSVHQTGGFRLQGKSKDQARRIIDDALSLEKAGAFALLLESIPLELAAYITERVAIPTIGIGAGSHCDGQILVFHDMIGFTKSYLPKFVRTYAHIHETVHTAMGQYISDIRSRSFPGEQESHALGQSVEDWLKE
jgi:3-methyl-2-oxobutanoate hydroxymethyltransferase